jgi:uncharacterized protein YegP (UPF0339 family)
VAPTLWVADGLVSRDSTEVHVKFKVFRRNGMWRWSLLARNGRVVADSKQTYHNRQDCLAGIAIVVSTDASTPIEEESDIGVAGGQMVGGVR